MNNRIFFSRLIGAINTVPGQTYIAVTKLVVFHYFCFY